MISDKALFFIRLAAHLDSFSFLTTTAGAQGFRGGTASDPGVGFPSSPGRVAIDRLFLSLGPSCEALRCPAARCLGETWPAAASLRPSDSEFGILEFPNPYAQEGFMFLLHHGSGHAGISRGEAPWLVLDPACRDRGRQSASSVSDDGIPP